MQTSIDHARKLRAAASALVASVVLCSCSPQTETAAPQPRPVRTVTIEQRAAGTAITLTGRIEAEDEVTLAFRISGRVLENDRKLGDRIEAGQVVARLESQNERNTLRAAQANLVASQAQLTQARNHFERQDTLLKQGWTTRANHDQAKQALQTVESQVDATEAEVKTAYDLVSFTELKADAPGVITAVGPGAGEVVQAGQMIFRVARRGGRDAVFDVPAQVIRTAPSDPRITVSLTDDPKVTTTGRVREVAPQADPVTRTFAVKVGLNDPPSAMRLGATVTGRMEGDSVPVINIPATALTKINSQPAVWVVDPSNQNRFDPECRRVALRPGKSRGVWRAYDRRGHCHRRRASPASWPEGSAARVGAVIWASTFRNGRSRTGR